MKFAYQESAFVTVAIVAIVSLQGVTSQQKWHRLDDAVYLVGGTIGQDYDEAQARCQGYGANLTKVDSYEIQAFLSSLITPPLQNAWCYWIGCNDREFEGQFRWLDGTPVTYDGWAQNEPNNDANPGDEDCACIVATLNANGRHGLWNDDRCTGIRQSICQKGIYNFHLTISRTNPGFANVYCAADVEIEGETLSPDDVKVSIGQTLSSSRPISHSSTSLDGEFRNNSFLIYNVTEGEQIFCYAGELPDKDISFSLATFSALFDFYALPELSSGPTVGEISSSSVTVFWSSWIPFQDSGDGPVVGYLIYQQTMDEEWIVVGRIDSGEGEGDLQPRMKFVLTELEPGTEYNISVSAVREGPGGEGPRSPPVTVTTPTLALPFPALPELSSGPTVGEINSTQKSRSPLVTVTTPSLESQQLRETTAVWMVLLVISLFGNVVLAIAMVIVCKRKQKKADLSRLRFVPEGAGDPKSPHYELPQPSAVRQHVYQGLKRTGVGSIQEGVYDDIADPEKLEYVNISSKVRK